MSTALAHTFTLDEISKNPEIVAGLVKDCPTCDIDTPGHIDCKFCPTCKGKGVVAFGAEIQAAVTEIEASAAEIPANEEFFDEFED